MPPAARELCSLDPRWGLEAPDPREWELYFKKLQLIRMISYNIATVK